MTVGDSAVGADERHHTGASSSTRVLARTTPAAAAIQSARVCPFHSSQAAKIANGHTSSASAPNSAASRCQTDPTSTSITPTPCTNCAPTATIPATASTRCGPPRSDMPSNGRPRSGRSNRGWLSSGRSNRGRPSSGTSARAAAINATSRSHGHGLGPGCQSSVPVTVSGAPP